MIAWASFNIEIRRVVLEDKEDKHTWPPLHAFNECYRTQRIKMILLYP